MTNLNKENRMFTKFVGRLEVEPLQQPRLMMGEFTCGRPAKGFLIQFDLEDDLADSIVTKIIPLGTDRHYSLILFVANFGNKIVHVEVWQM